MYSNNHDSWPSAQRYLDGNALTNAARNGHLEIVRFLLEHGADVNTDCTIFIQIIAPPADRNLGGSALINAAENGHAAVVHFLVEHGADVKNCMLCI